MALEKEQNPLVSYTLYFLSMFFMIFGLALLVGSIVAYVFNEVRRPLVDDPSILFIGMALGFFIFATAIVGICSIRSRVKALLVIYSIIILVVLILQTVLIIMINGDNQLFQQLQSWVGKSVVNLIIYTSLAAEALALLLSIILIASKGKSRRGFYANRVPIELATAQAASVPSIDRPYDRSPGTNLIGTNGKLYTGPQRFRDEQRYVEYVLDEKPVAILGAPPESSADYRDEMGGNNSAFAATGDFDYEDDPASSNRDSTRFEDMYRQQDELLVPHTTAAMLSNGSNGTKTHLNYGNRRIITANAVRGSIAFDEELSMPQLPSLPAESWLATDTASAVPLGGYGDSSANTSELPVAPPRRNTNHRPTVASSSSYSSLPGGSSGRQQPLSNRFSVYEDLPVGHQTTADVMIIDNHQNDTDREPADPSFDSSTPRTYF